MRKITFGVANSLDNYIARKNEAVDWILWSEEVNPLMKEFWRNIDTILMGRKTYEAGLRQGGGGGGFSGMKTYIFSRTMKESPQDKNTEIILEDVTGFVSNLKKQKGPDICVMGGGVQAKSLFEANLIDEIDLNIHPVLLGSGIPFFFEMKRQIDLELIDCQTFKTGCVYVSYRVKK